MVDENDKSALINQEKKCCVTISKMYIKINYKTRFQVRSLNSSLLRGDAIYLERGVISKGEIMTLLQTEPLNLSSPLHSAH
jgi:hypothetical protein